MTSDRGTEPLSFGTDGWRDVIADRFTFSNLARAAQGYATWMRSQGARLVLVGHDTRFLGPEFARETAEILAGNGLAVMLADSFLPTPALSFAARHFRADGAVMLTASHNPARYQGFKLKGGYGGSATDDTYRGVAAVVADTAPADVRRATAGIESFDIRDDYYRTLDRLLDLNVLRAGSGLLIHDAMGGAASGWLRGYFEHAELKPDIAEFRGRPDPLFHGVNPEPIAPNLRGTAEVAWDNGPLFAVATDGDGDRLGVILPDGRYFNSHQIFAVLLMHLHGRGLRGRVVKTFTVSRIIERFAASLDLPVLETPVGFKYIAEAMLRGDVLVGGEESGGIGVHGHIPERDGILNALLLLEAVLASGSSLSELFAAIEEQAGWRHAYDRSDIRLDDNALKDRVMAGLQADPEVFGGRVVESVERLDGVKLNLAGDAWLLFRPSGTEPVLRVYCEAASEEDVTALLGEAERFVDS